MARKGPILVLVFLLKLLQLLLLLVGRAPLRAAGLVLLLVNYGLLLLLVVGQLLEGLLHAGKLDVGRLDKTVDNLRLHVVVVGGCLDAVVLSPAE